MIHLCFRDMIHCLAIQGFSLLFAKCMLRYISGFSMLRSNIKVVMFVSVFSVKKLLALALLLCALASLSNAACYFKGTKAGIRQEKHYIYTHRHTVW